MLIIASMIEREVQVPEERKLVAAVIYNRLQAGMPLGIDATIRYATGNCDEPLSESELATDSPYNTRVNPGLPPGPIGNPGLASIEAAAHPAQVRRLLLRRQARHLRRARLRHDRGGVRAGRGRLRRRRCEANGGGSPTDC